MSRVYLAGPMRGKISYNFPAFEKAAAFLRANGHSVFSPAERDLEDGFDPTTDVAHSISHYMAIDLPEVCKCDVIALLPGWEDSEGCRIELSVARKLNKAVWDAATMEPSKVKAPLVYGEWPVGPGGAGGTAGTMHGGNNAGVGEVRVTDAKTGGQKGSKIERFDLIPTWALREVSRVYGMGEAKYPSDAGGPNWRKGYRWGLSFAACLRHLTLFWMGQTNDPESGYHHLAHAAWHCLTLMTFSRETLGTDDRCDKRKPE